MAEIGLTCPHCNQELSIDTAYAGQAVGCPHCAGEFTVPDMPATPPAPQVGAAPKLAAPPKLIAPATGAAARPPAPQQPPVGAPQPQQPQPGYAPPGQQPQPGYAPPGQPPYPGAPAPAPGYAPQFPGGPKVGIGAVIANPADSQAEFIQANGPGGTSKWGWILFGVWVVAGWLAFWRAGAMLFSAIGGGGAPRGRMRMPKLEFSDHLQFILTAAVPMLMLIVVLLLFNASRSTKARFGSIVFTSGVTGLSFIYFFVFMILVSFLGPQSGGGGEILGHLTTIITIFALAGTTLSIKASLVNVIGITRKAAYWMVPGVLLAVGYLSNWVIKLLLEMMN